MNAYQKFLQVKSTGDLTHPTSFSSLLILSAHEGSHKDCLKRFTIERIREELADRRNKKWTQPVN